MSSDLVEIRPLRADDFEALYAVAKDPLIWEQHPASTRHEYDVFKALFDESLASGGALVILDVATHEIIGSSRYHGYEEARSEIEIGWTYLARKYWGGRYNGEVKRLMLQHAFRYVDRVLFLIGPKNFRSQRVVEKIGAVRVRSRVDGSGRESYVYQLSKPASAPDAGLE